MILQRTTRVTANGQVTVPADVRRLLGVYPHDQITFVVEEDQVRLTSAISIVTRTAGMLKGSQLRISLKEEAITVEEAVAEEAEKRS